MIDVEDYPKRSNYNAYQISNMGVCGCYFCVRVFGSSEIEEFVDDGETALCPNCGVDALLPGETDLENLTMGLERWFMGIVSQNVVEAVDRAVRSGNGDKIEKLIHRLSESNK